MIAILINLKKYYGILKIQQYITIDTIYIDEIINADDMIQKIKNYKLIE